MASSPVTSSLPNGENGDMPLRVRRPSGRNLPTLHIPEPCLGETRPNSCPLPGCSSFNKYAPDKDTVDEGKELFQHFILDQINKEGLKAPQECFSPTVVKTPDEYRKSEWAEAGSELRHMADEFAKTKEREKVRKKAENVSMQEITKEKFMELLGSLFNQNLVTKERIMVLFFFCSDLAIQTLKRKAVDLFKRLLEWSMAYIADKVCGWVAKNGGWKAVLLDGSIRVLRNIIIVAGIAIISYAAYKYFMGKNS